MNTRLAGKQFEQFIVIWEMHTINDTSLILIDDKSELIYIIRGFDSENFSDRYIWKE